MNRKTLFILFLFTFVLVVPGITQTKKNGKVTIEIEKGGVEKGKIKMVSVKEHGNRTIRKVS